VLTITPHVRVDAFELTDDNRDLAWQLGRSLWSRRAESGSGTFELPQLPPGEFGVQVVAVTPAGRPRPLAPWRRTFALTGSNGFVEHVQLEPACALQLDLVEPNGDAFDPAVHGNVTVTLNGVAERGIQRRWTAAAADGKGQVTELDRVPGRSPIWLAAPTDPGNYLLEVFVNGDPRVSQQLTLRPEAQTERVTVY
ncbi:MAG: hypothetical protein KAI24_15990, partial [Planctomycetes bacterium]|nr:hypothetical protein [Planctomycetota bacterium]